MVPQVAHADKAEVVFDKSDESIMTSMNSGWSFYWKYFNFGAAAFVIILGILIVLPNNRNNSYTGKEILTPKTPGLKTINLQKSRTQNVTTNIKDKLTLLMRYRKQPDSEVKLKHVRNVFERYGYQVTDDVRADWDVLWSHESPFIDMRDSLRNLKPHQRVNHIPGNGYVAVKVEFATSGGLNIPPAFRLPEEKYQFLQYAKENPSTQFVEKNNRHRHIYLKPVKEINLNSENIFVQEFIANPLLIDGRKFEFGIYTVVTSIHPLRIYKIQEDLIIRYTKIPYQPFNESNIAQYVINEDSLQYWESTVMQKYLNRSYSIQDSFEATLKSVGADPKHIWEQIDKSIVSVYFAQEKHFLRIIKDYKNIRNFFEILRFDFLIDEDYKVHALEANMSPNLASDKNPRNANIYEQVIHSLLSIVGLSTYVHPPLQNAKISQRMMTHKRNIMVFPEICLNCLDCIKFECKLCASCLTEDLAMDLQMAYREYLSKFRATRLFPPKMTQEEAKLGIPKEYGNISSKNKLIYRWFQGKCLLDEAWC